MIGISMRCVVQNDSFGKFSFQHPQVLNIVPKNTSTVILIQSMPLKRTHLEKNKWFHALTHIVLTALWKITLPKYFSLWVQDVNNHVCIFFFSRGVNKHLQIITKKDKSEDVNLRLRSFLYWTHWDPPAQRKYFVVANYHCAVEYKFYIY